jgi:hypothetical protein
VTAAHLARLIGCSERAAGRWLSGERAPATQFRPRLHRLTGLEEFRPTPLDELAAAGPVEREGYARATLAVEKALKTLETSVQPFVTGSPGAREFLRRSIDPSRVARVTNLAQLLFDEEAFSDWLLLESALGGEGT